MADSVRVILLSCGGAVVLVIVLESQSLPQPWSYFASLLAIAAGLITWFLLERPHEVRAERSAEGLCPGCGYDLTGNVKGVCPECGEEAR